MPWRECHMMDERLRFVARLLDGEKMARLCREFEISRKTGYKIFSRYKDCGLQGLTDRSRRPYRHARQLPFQIEKAIIQLKQEHPSWGAPKIRERLRRKHSEIQCPAISTVHAILDRNGMVKRRRRRRYKPEGTSLSRPSAPNDLWCAARRSPTPRPCTLLASLSRFLRISAYPKRFAPITALPLPAPTRSSASRLCRCGGCALASILSASSPGTRSKTGATRECT